MEYKLEKKAAEEEFNKWADNFYLDRDIESMDSEEADDFIKIKKQFMLALRIGRISIDEEGDLTLKLIKPFGDKEELVFAQEFNSTAFIKMDRHKEKESMKKTLSFLGGWTKTDPKQLYRLDARDMKLCLSLTTLFLA